MKPDKHERSQQKWLDLCWKVHDDAQSFVLRFVQGQGQKSERKQKN